MDIKTKMAESNSGDDPEVIAKDIITTLTVIEVHELALECIIHLVRTELRRRALVIERQAVLKSSQPDHDFDRKTSIRVGQQIGAQDRWGKPDMARWESADREVKEYVIRNNPWHAGIPRDSKEWLEFASKPGNESKVESAERADRRRMLQEAKFRLGHDEIVKKLDESMLIAWEDLADTKFALADGARVTWGEATTIQHQERITILRVNALANIEAMRRHEAAILDLEAIEAKTLNELLERLSVEVIE